MTKDGKALMEIDQFRKENIVLKEKVTELEKSNQTYKSKHQDALAEIEKLKKELELERLQT